MTGTEMRAIRKRIALTQYELAQRLSVSRKTVVGWEASDEELDQGVAFQLLGVAGQIRVIENAFWVQRFSEGPYAVVRRCIRNLPSTSAANYTSGELMLYGVFKRRDHPH